MIIIRSDSSFQIGTGHIMRCLVLAEGLREIGQKVHFVCRDLPGNVSQKIKEQNFALTLISESASEADEIREILTMKPDWLVVDHYGLDEKWENQLKPNCGIFVIDDLADRKHSADILVDQNFHSKKGIYKSLVTPACKVYEGPQFAFLRKSVLGQKTARQRNGCVLCFFGGTDFTGESLKLARALNDVKPDVKFKLVIGKKNVNYEALSQMNSSHFELLIDPPDWEAQLAESSLYFGSGGTVTWERFYLGTPGVVVAVAENQYQIAKDLAAAGLQLFWGKAEGLIYTDTIPKLVAVSKDSSLLQALVERSKKSVRPFPREILELVFAKPAEKFHLRPATMEHVQFLFELRNDPATRIMFKNPEPVKFEDHQAWLGNKLKDTDSRLYIGYFENRPVGQFRVDSDFDTSVSIHPAYRGKGFGEKLIREGTKMFFLEKPGTEELKAEIKSENIGSIKSFQAAGYTFAESADRDQEYVTFTAKAPGN